MVDWLYHSQGTRYCRKAVHNHGSDQAEAAVADCHN